MKNRRAVESSAFVPRVAVIGAGFAGLTAAIRLTQDGADVRVYERSAGVGGVWRDNDYPGAACDVPSFLYSWSFAPKPDWSRRFAGQAEILAYIAATTTRFGIDDRIRFDHDLVALTFDDELAVWNLEFANGEAAQADIVVAALGQMSTPAIPVLAGIGSFAGAAFHTAQWRHDVCLDGKKVVVVGAGASAIQVVPAIADRAASVTVLQRSPGYVLSKGTLETSGGGSPLRARLARYRGYLSKELSTPRLVRWPKLVAGAERAYQRDLADWVPNAELHRRVNPQDRYGCKRILVSNDWYATLQLPQVTLSDSAVAEVTPNSVRLMSGEDIAADVIIYGTGFRTTAFLPGIRVVGEGGRELGAAWRETPNAYLGMAMTGFPNLFLMYGPNTNPAWNSVLMMLEFQTNYLRSVIRRWKRSGPFTMDLRSEAGAKFARQLAARSARSVWVTGCANWFTTADGTNTQNWPALVSEYWARTRRVRWSDYNIRSRRSMTVPAESVGERVGGK